MKVVHVVRQFHPQVGGLEGAVRSLCRTLRDSQGVECRVVTLNRLYGSGQPLPATGAVDGTPVARIPWRGSRRYPLAPAVLRHLGDADLVHVHAVDFFFDFLAASRPLHGKPMVATTHGGFFHTDFAQGLKRLWFRGITRRSSRAYGRILATSANDARAFAAIAGDRVETVENGVDVAKFAGCGDGPPRRTLIAFGRLAPHKNLAGALHLLAALRRLDPAWRLIIAGSEWGVTVADLQALAAALGVGEAVSFVRDPDDDALRARIREATYFLSLSGYEGFGLAAVEAMAAGLVPVLSDIPTHRTFVERSGAGLCGAGEDGEAMAAGVEGLHRTLCDGPAALEATRRRMDAFCAPYGWAHAAARHAGIYDAVLAGARG